MKKFIISVITLLVLIFILIAPSMCEEKQNSTIKVGMEFTEAKEILNNFNAQEVTLSLGYTDESKPSELKSYMIPNITPYVIITYEKQNNLITGLTLYYEYQHKMDPNNKWLNVEEIDLKNINP